MTPLKGFFNYDNYVHKGHKQSNEFSFIHVGNEPFHAVAVALIDALYTTKLSKTQRSHAAVLKKILGSFSQYFPKYISNQPYLTPSERMESMLHNPRKSELVDCMAYILRQLAIDELYANPLNYREVFCGLNADTSTNYLRDLKIMLPESALNALAQSLEITLTLSFKESGRELRMKEVYHGDNPSASTKLNLTLQVQGHDYFPAVKHKEMFAYVGQLAINAPKPVENTQNPTETLADIIALIAQDNKQLVQSFNQWRKIILSMVAAGELSYEQLIERYITFLPMHSTHLISASALAQPEQAISGAPVEQKQHTIELLANALADWISTNQVQADRLFDSIENKNVSLL